MKLINHELVRKPRCYGRLFPEFGEVRTNAANGGKVFSAFLESDGLGFHETDLVVNEKSWEECTRCNEFDFCYKLSMAKLAFGAAVKAQAQVS